MSVFENLAMKIGAYAKNVDKLRQKDELESGYEQMEFHYLNVN